ARFVVLFDLKELKEIIRNKMNVEIEKGQTSERNINSFLVQNKICDTEIKITCEISFGKHQQLYIYENNIRLAKDDDDDENDNDNEHHHENEKDYGEKEEEERGKGNGESDDDESGGNNVKKEVKLDEPKDNNNNKKKK
ncbi:hypothetical protein RFI_33798, partial [Reticulomyxa filosa]